MQASKAQRFVSFFLFHSSVYQIHLIRFEGIEQIQVFQCFSQSRWASEQKDAIREIRYRGGFETRPSLILPQLRKGCGLFALQQRDTWSAFEQDVRNR